MARKVGSGRKVQDEEKAPPPVQRDVIGPDALRERLRLLAPGFLTLRVYREDVILTLRLLDELAVSRQGCEGAKALKRRGRKFEEAREATVEGRITKLLRIRPDVSEGIEAFARSKGGSEPWSYNRSVNELLSAALLSERAP